MAKKISHQRHLSKKELRFRVPNQRLQAWIESWKKSLFHQKYSFNSLIENLIYTNFTGKSDALQGNLWWIFVMMGGYVEVDLYRNREERVWH